MRRGIGAQAGFYACSRDTTAAFLPFARGDNLAARRALHRYREAVHELGVPGEATLMVERLLDSISDELHL